MKKKTLYISIEGTDGGGKTTLVKNLVAKLESLNQKVLLTKEFGSSLDPACSELRNIALSSTYKIDELAGQLIFGAIARQHQVRVIKPALAQAEIDVILSDWGIDSNFAYGPAHGLSSKTINQLFSVVYQEATLPDLTIYLDIEPQLSASRRADRKPENFKNEGQDRVELKGSSLQAQVRKNFLKLLKKYPQRIKIIQVTESKTPQIVLEEAWSLLNSLRKGL